MSNSNTGIFASIFSMLLTIFIGLLCLAPYFHLYKSLIKFLIILLKYFEFTFAFWLSFKILNIKNIKTRIFCIISFAVLIFITVPIISEYENNYMIKASARFLNGFYLGTIINLIIKFIKLVISITRKNN